MCEHRAILLPIPTLRFIESFPLEPRGISVSSPLTPATQSVSAVLVPLQSEFDRLQGRHNCPRKGPDYRERAQKYRHALAQAEVLEVPAREAVEPATSSLDCA